MKTDIQQLEKIALEYHTNESIPDIHIENICQEYIIEWLLQQIPATANVLELGYGDGLVTEALAKSGCKLTLLEGAKTLVDIAQTKHPEVKCIYTLFEDFAPTHTYDVILASHVLEHVDDPQAIVKQLATWLDKNGKIIIVVPNKHSMHRQLAVIMGLQPELDTLSKRDHLVGHQRVYSLETLTADVQAGGLRVIESKGFFFKALPNSMMLEYSEALLRALNIVSKTMPKDFMANIAVVAVKSE